MDGLFKNILKLVNLDIPPSASGIGSPAGFAHAGIVIVNFEGDMTSSAQQLADGRGVVQGMLEGGSIDLGYFHIVDMDGNPRRVALNANPEFVPVVPFPYG